MAIYLQLRVGPVHLLLDALRVHEVMGADTLSQGGQGHVQWRDEVLHFVDMGAFLQLPTEAATMAVVYSPDENGQSLMLGVSEVLGLRDLHAEDWRPMPRLPVASAAFVDAVWLEPELQRQSFRWRYPIAIEVFQATDSDVTLEDLGQDGPRGIVQ